MQFNSDAEFYLLPKLILNYDEKYMWNSVSWLGFQIEYNKREFVKSRRK